jgi:glycosyltransferase involved in cell wall biosynthesis
VSTTSSPDLADQPVPRISQKVLVVFAEAAMAAVLVPTWLIQLKQRGCDVHVCAAPSDFLGKLASMGLPAHQIFATRRYSVWGLFKYTWSVLKLLNAERPRLVISHGAAAGVAARLAAFLARRKCVVTNHGFIFDENMNAAGRLTLLATEGVLSRLCSAIMFVNREDCATAESSRLFSRRTRYQYIGNGITFAPYEDLSDVARRRRAARARLGFTGECAVVGFVGRLVREKGLMEFVEVIRILGERNANAHFLVIGEAHAGDRGICRNQFLARLDEQGLRPAVTMLGFRDDVPDILPALDVLCHPSYKESFGRVIVEAAMCSVPAVAFDVRGCRDVIAHRRTGLLVPFRDVQSLADMTARLICDPQARGRMGIEARRRARQLYDERAVASVFCDAVVAALET